MGEFGARPSAAGMLHVVGILSIGCAETMAAMGDRDLWVAGNGGTLLSLMPIIKRRTASVSIARTRTKDCNETTGMKTATQPPTADPAPSGNKVRKHNRKCLD